MTITDEPTTIVRGPDDAPATWFLNGLMTTLATRSETGGAYCLMHHRLTAANPPVHVQVVEDEAFFVLEGELELEVDGVVRRAGPGTFAFVPRGAVHSFGVISAEVRMLVLASGEAPEGGLHAFFEAAGRPAPQRTLPTPEAPDPAVLGALAEPRGIILLGPPG